MGEKTLDKKHSMKWIQEYCDSLWFKILFDADKLGLDQNFLSHEREGGKLYNDYVNERILSAGQLMRSSPGEMIGINCLLHTASSIILIEGKRDRVDETLTFIKESQLFNDIDNTSVFTSVALYFLICNAENNLIDDDIKIIKHIHTRLDHMNWFMGEDGLKKLGIPKLKKM